MRRIGAIGAVILFALGVCGGKQRAAPESVPQITLTADGPLSPALISASQLRRVPGFATATVVPLNEVKIFEDPDPRGPCGAKVPVLKLNDAVGLSWNAQAIRGGAQLVIRGATGQAKKFLSARLNDIRPDCAVYTTKNAQGVTQEQKYDHAVRLPIDADQALAVVTALRIGGDVRAATSIEVRRGDVLSRAVIFTESPMDNTIVRGIGALMAKGLQRLE